MLFNTVSCSSKATCKGSKLVNGSLLKEFTILSKVSFSFDMYALFVGLLIRWLSFLSLLMKKLELEISTRKQTNTINCLV